jgi:hypothetical protein
MLFVADGASSPRLSMLICEPPVDPVSIAAAVPANAPIARIVAAAMVADLR